MGQFEFFGLSISGFVSTDPEPRCVTIQKKFKLTHRHISFWRNRLYDLDAFLREKKEAEPETDEAN